MAVGALFPRDVSANFAAKDQEAQVDWIFQTDGSYSYVFLRFGLALTFFAHSSQQILG